MNLTCEKIRGEYDEGSFSVAEWTYVRAQWEAASMPTERNTDRRKWQYAAGMPTRCQNYVEVYGLNPVVRGSGYD